MNTPEEEELLIEAASTAWRPTDRSIVQAHPAWHDLDAAGRIKAFEVTRQLRMMESALDPRGLSTTAHAVLTRLGKTSLSG